MDLIRERFGMVTLGISVLVEPGRLVLLITKMDGSLRAYISSSIEWEEEDPRVFIKEDRKSVV